jgi:hypothetical protein
VSGSQLQHNIHGIDIDPRATQIAKLTLWLRAQRAWQEQLLEVATRPSITRSNVVCAEPMPGERELLGNFVDQQFPEPEQGLVQQLLEAIFDKMQLAGEAGSLLRIEEEIRDAIDEARREWQKLAVQQQDLFSAAELAALGQVGSSLVTDLQNLTNNFWIDIEERIYTALRHYSEQAESRRSFQRRLFVEDAAQGFAFIDVSRKRYDVALMNPPFGEPATSTLDYTRRIYPTAADNLLIAFIERFHFSLLDNGRLGAITDRSWINKRFYEAFRRDFVLSQSTLAIWLDLGWEVLDANVEVAAHIHSSSNQSALFLNLAKSSDKADDACHKLRELSSLRIHLLESFTRFPGLSFVYDLDPVLVRAFVNGEELGETEFTSYGGLKAGDSERLFRTAWEIPASGLATKVWAPFQNGSPFCPYYYGCYLVVRCDQQKWDNVLSYESSRVTNLERYFQPGIFYGKRTEWMYGYKGRLGQVPSMEGHLVQPVDWNKYWFSLLTINSSVYQEIANKLCGQHKYAGYINPIRLDLSKMPDWTAEVSKVTSELEGLDSGNEISWLFSVPLSLVAQGSGPFVLLESIQSATKVRSGIVERANKLRREYNSYIEEKLEWHSKESEAPTEVDYVRLLFEASDSVRLEAFNLVSYFVGTAFGRWDIRYAIGSPSDRDLLDPFAALPVCPPGQLQNSQGLPAYPEDVPSSYPVDIAWDGILVDDRNHLLDIAKRVSYVIHGIWNDTEGGLTAKAIEHEACNLLGANSLHDYFTNPAGFFSDHLKRYSKSRRQAPIYWQLSAGSGGYSAWLYYHRFTQDTLYRVLRDFVEPRIQQAERDQFELESQGALSGDAAVRLQEAQTLLQDLRVFKNELDLVAPLWNPDLNDGVIINHAILWRITPYTPWQKKCKECWDKLVKGDYDWAHLAFHLWPERVIPKCTTDRSLAIAHGLEERLWQETNNGNWLPRQLSDADFQALIAENSNPAVKSALERFLSAPPPVAPSRTRASRGTSASGTSAPRRPRGTTPVVDAEATRQVLLALTAAPSDGLAKAAIADRIGVEANAITAVIKQLKDSGQIEQLGAARGAKYRLSETGRARLDQEEA